MIDSDSRLGLAPVAEPSLRRDARLADYLRLARFDHVTKHVFVIPGIVLAFALRGIRNDNFLLHVLAGAICAFAIASANYVINEWLDRDFDRHHPTKSARVSVQIELNPWLVYGLWASFVVVGLAAAAMSSRAMFIIGVLFALQGIVYNVPPIRTKEVAFLDVISESINNPFRLLIGWLMVDATTLPPGSIILAYWLAGAFLMAAKRLSEYREIVAAHGKDLLERYRKSFANYTEATLLASCFVYALLSMALFSVYMIKYRVEYILLMPFLSLLFAIYIALTMQTGSVAQAPEKLFRSRSLMVGVATFVFILGGLTFIDIAALKPLTEDRFIAIQ